MRPPDYVQCLIPNTPHAHPPVCLLFYQAVFESSIRLLCDVLPGLPATRNQVLVLTYDLVKKLSPQTAARFGVVICDESHQLKNKDTQRTKAVSNVVRGAAVAVLLTGTPLLSRPIEVWSQVSTANKAWGGQAGSHSHLY